MRKQLCKTRNFTLVEVIAVLIILGILMAVAVPKYFSLIDDAKTRAAEGAVAEGLSMCSMAYAQACLRQGTVPTTVGAVDTANTVYNLAKAAVDAATGDFAFTLAANGTTGLDVTATGKTGTKVAGASATATWLIPQ